MMHETKAFCFYTGEEVEVGTSATVEHLVSIKYLNLKNGKFNLVPCHKRINGAVGNAPLAVKFAIRDALKKLVILPRTNQQKRIKIYANAAKAFMRTYRVHGQFPWQWKNHIFKEGVPERIRNLRRQRMKDAYMNLLTEEEIKLGAYVK